MVASLVTYGRIETTEAKAKELRSIAERTINWGVGVSELLGKEPSQLSKEEQAKLVHARRMAQRVLKNEDALRLLFSEVAPKLAGRPGGYTRVLKTRNRRGDAAPMAFIELVTARAS
ncbi:50S ribosomal protein L17 [Haliangium ochraceum]